MKTIGLMLAGLALAGCKTDITADIYTSDLVTAMDGEELTAPLTVGLPAATKAKCQETADSILAAMQDQMPGTEFVGCDAIGFNDFAFFRAQVPIVPIDLNSPPPDAPFAIGVGTENGKDFDVWFLISADTPRALWDALPEELTQYQTFKFEPDLSATLTNDLRGTVSVTSDDVFADGTPYPGTVTWDIDRRGQVNLDMSDVTNASFGTERNVAHIVQFTLPDG